MAAKPARLTTNRHGTFSLRWIVPVRLRDEHGRPREVRISLRTRDQLRARILALEFNLALERNRAMTPPCDPSTIASWSLQAGNVKIEVNSAEDQELFQQAMKDDPDLRAALMEAMRSGMQPAEAIAALVSQVKSAVGDAGQRPTHRKQPTAKHWWKTLVDPFADAWPVVEGWLIAEPAVSAKALMERLATLVPDAYADKTQLRTLQRRVKAWRAERAKEMVLGRLRKHEAMLVEV